MYGDVLKSVQGMVFFGVPHRGADPAFWQEFVDCLFRASLMGSRGDIARATKFTAGPLQGNSEVLADTSQQFVQLAVQLHVRTFYEGKKVFGKLVFVPSATFHEGRRTEKLICQSQCRWSAKGPPRMGCRMRSWPPCPTRTI